jgi:hypothetical protein
MLNLSKRFYAQTFEMEKEVTTLSIASNTATLMFAR